LHQLVFIASHHSNHLLERILLIANLLCEHSHVIADVSGRIVDGSGRRLIYGCLAG
jgi:hypothetical protein